MYLERGIQMEIPIVILIVIGILFFLLIFVILNLNIRNKKINLELHQAQEQFRSIIGSANDAIILADSKSTIISWNKGAEKIFGYQEAEVLNQNLNMIIPKKYREAHVKGTARFITTKVPKVIGQTVELQGLHKNGKEIPVELSLSYWEINGETFFSGIIRDISERKQAEAKINFLAFHDELTKLPNRRLFNMFVAEEITKAKAKEDSMVLMMLDLDGFKNVNDTFGHSFGDLLLIEIGYRLNRVIENNGLVARMGGDEFTLIRTGMKEQSEAAELAQQIMTIVEEPVLIEHQKIFISTSIGIAWYPNNGQEVETLMRRADMAMYLAKSEGKSTFRFYIPSLEETNHSTQ